MTASNDDTGNSTSVASAWRKVGPGNEPASPPDLDGAEVHPGNRVAAGGEVTSQRHTTSAAQVQDRAAGRDPFLELRQPGAVALRFLVVASVPVGQCVVAPANDVLGRVHGLRLRGSREAGQQACPVETVAVKMSR
jgi:hypothetical protein